MAVLVLSGPFQARAQEPPDTVPPVQADTVAAPVVDSLQVPDSLQVADSTGIAPDSLTADSLQVLPDSLVSDSAATAVIDLDTIPVPVMPSAPRGESLGWGNETWEWEREDLRSTRAFDLTELLMNIPGVVPLRGGDYGMPRTVSAFGAGPGRIRVFWDGFEFLPVEGGVDDLNRIPLSGLERVRVERSGGELRVEVWSLEQSDPRPYSVIETGTGDLDTNLFRGTFGHPRVLGGKLHVALDRMDTGGTGRAEPGSAVGFWLSYSFEPSDRWGIRAELKRMASDRDTIYAPGSVIRSDWIVRGRVEPWDDIVTEAFVGRSRASKSKADSLVAFTEATRTQYGVRAGVSKPTYWGTGTLRIQDGDGVPGSVFELRGGARSERVGGAQATWLREGWQTGSAASFLARGWTRSFFGVSLFGTYESGGRGVPFILPASAPAVPDSMGTEEPAAPAAPLDPATFERFTDRTTSRLGAQFEWKGLRISAARLMVEADSLHPVGLPTDAGGLVLPGGTRAGMEAVAVLPLWPRGLSLRGSALRWDDQPAWRYLPKQSWQGTINFERTFLPSGNLEFFVTLGIQGRDPMIVPLLADDSTGDDPIAATVPWGQTVFARLQIRVMTFRIYVTADNLALKTDNQDYPGRFLPNQRVVTGVRWTLWN